MAGRSGGLPWIAALLFVMVAAWPGAATAHTRLIASEPQANAVLKAAPARITLDFSAPPEAGFSEMQWSQAAQEKWHALEVTQQATQLEAALPQLGPGRYKIRWSVLSRDGHRQRGVLEVQID